MARRRPTEVADPEPSSQTRTRSSQKTPSSSKRSAPNQTSVSTRGQKRKAGRATPEEEELTDEEEEENSEGDNSDEDDDEIEEEDRKPSKKNKKNKRDNIAEDEKNDHDYNPKNISSFELGEDKWNKKFPPLSLGMLDPPEEWHNQKTPSFIDGGSRRPKIGTRGYLMRDFAACPAYIKERGYHPDYVFIEYLFRTNPNFGYGDLMARLPKKAVKAGTKNRRTAMNHMNNTRARLVRSDRGTKTRAWSNRHKGRAPKVQLRRLNGLTQEQLDLNTTWNVTPQGISPPTNPELVFPHGIFLDGISEGIQASDQIIGEAKLLDELQYKAECRGLDHWDKLPDDDVPKDWKANKGVPHKKSGRRMIQKKTRDLSSDEESIDEPAPKRRKGPQKKSDHKQELDESDDDSEIYEKRAKATISNQRRRGGGKSPPARLDLDSDDEELDDELDDTFQHHRTSAKKRRVSDPENFTPRRHRAGARRSTGGKTISPEEYKKYVRRVSEQKLLEQLLSLSSSRLSSVLKKLADESEEVQEMISCLAKSLESRTPTPPKERQNTYPIKLDPADDEKLEEATEAIIREGTSEHAFPNLEPEIALEAMKCATRLAREANVPIPDHRSINSGQRQPPEDVARDMQRRSWHGTPELQMGQRVPETGYNRPASARTGYQTHSTQGSPSSQYSGAHQTSARHRIDPRIAEYQILADENEREPPELAGAEFMADQTFGMDLEDSYED